MSKKFENRSKGFKLLTLALAFVLVIGASVAGTLAWLSAKTGTVTNTFTSAELFDTDDEENPGSFTLWEHKVADVDNDGVYEWVKTDGESVIKVDNREMADEVNGNSYNILPGVNIPKDPTVDVVNLEGHAYLYIKVTNNLTDGLSCTIDSDNWTVLDSTKYPGVYVYSGSQAENCVIKATSSEMKTFTVGILENNQITVAGDYSSSASEITLAFEAYMVQATGNGSSAADAWANTYGK